MIQIYKQEPYYNSVKKKWETPFKPVFGQVVGFPDLATMLRDSDSWIQSIPEDQRVNLFYTLNPQKKENNREARFFEYLAFDVDKVPVELTEKVALRIFETICKSLSIDPEKTGLVISGNGVHILIALDARIQFDPADLESKRQQYKIICTKLEKLFSNTNLEGVKLDPSILDISRVLRLPGTTNLKPNKGETWENPTKRTRCYTLKFNLEPQMFDLEKAAGGPIVRPSEALAKLGMGVRYDHDVAAIEDGCDFLKWTKASPQEVSEPEWYAMLSIIGNLRTDDDQQIGHKLAHEYSKGHPGYTPEETDAKLQQALEASGPRKCVGIQSIWGKCQTCPNFGRVSSPIGITGPDHIKTKSTGFYNIGFDRDGNPVRSIPNYDDLMKWFRKKHIFSVHQKRTYTFNGVHWVQKNDEYLKSFAEKWLDPKPAEKHRVEFQNKLFANEIIDDYSWFADSVVQKANFKNGVFDLETRKLEPHSHKYGFKSVIPHNYDAQADCPRFKQFLKEVTCDDQDLENILVEYMGYAISGMDASKLMKILILIGEGRNGKSVFLDCLRNLVGKDFFSTVPMGELLNSERRINLDGKLFNIVEEISPKDFKDPAFIKDIATGGTVMARSLYKDAINIKINAKLIMACNQFPKTQDHTVGLYRRILFVPFNAKFDETNRDINLREKLNCEAAGIFNLALTGLDRLIKQEEFTHSKSVQKVMMDFKEESDPVEYIAQNYIEDTGSQNDFLSSTDLFGDVTLALKDDNFRFQPTKHTFMTKFGKMFEHRKARKQGGHGARGYWGLRFVKEGQKY